MLLIYLSIMSSFSVIRYGNVPGFRCLVFAVAVMVNE
jgi:hypothetical protein